MSGAELSYRVALLAFPKPYREERGEEIVATILEGGDGRRPRLRELVGLFWAGVGQQALAAGGERAASSVRVGLRLGAFALLWLGTVVEVAMAFNPFLAPGFVRVAGGQRYEIVGIVGAALALLSLTALSRGWWAAPLAFSLAWQFTNCIFIYPNSPAWPWNLDGGRVDARTVSLWAIGLVPALLLLVARPRGDEPRDLRPPRWALGALLVGVLISSQGLFFTSWLGRPLAVLLVVWLVLGWRDLRLAIAGATVTAFAGFSTVLYAGSTPWIAPIHLLTYGFLLGAVVALAIGLGGRRVNA